MSEESVSNNQSKRPGLVLSFFGAVVAFVLPQILVLPVVLLLISFQIGDNAKVFLLRTIVQLLSLIIIVVIIKFSSDNWYSYIGFNKFKNSALLLILVALPVYVVLSSLITIVLYSLLNFDIDQKQDIGFANIQGWDLWLIFASVVIVTPIVEEVIFRGVLFKAFRQKTTFFWAAIVTSVVFAVAHGQINVGIDVFILSMVLCYLREKSDSIWPPIIMHSIKNFVAFYYLFIIGTS